MRSLTAVIAVMAALVACERSRSPSEYRVPASYRGWVVTVYSAESHPPLRTVAGYLVHDIPADGVLLTSSRAQYGWAADRFVMISDDGKAVPMAQDSSVRVQFHATGSGFGDCEVGYFFIGTDAEFRAAEPVDSALERACAQRRTDS